MNNHIVGMTLAAVPILLLTAYAYAVRPPPNSIDLFSCQPVASGAAANRKDSKPLVLTAERFVADAKRVPVRWTH